jgi:hypothetical protein
MSVSYGGDKITFEDGSTVSSGWAGFKNRIINGAMVVDQRNAGASVFWTSSNNGSFITDRWKIRSGINGGTTANLSIQQSSTAPAGFNKSIGITVNVARTPVSGDRFAVEQPIEGLNITDLAWGTASASPVTLSFWVRSSVTGTHSVAISNFSRAYPATYTINSQNTWEYKTITISGDQTGTYSTDNSTGFVVSFDIGEGSDVRTTANAWATGTYLGATGSVSIVATQGATFYVTGVQFEKGSTASSFEYRPLTTELQLCQRYFEKSFNQSTTPANNIASTEGTNFSAYYSGGGRSTRIDFKVTKRAVPSITIYGGNATGGTNLWGYYNYSAWIVFTTTSPESVSDSAFRCECTKSGSFTNGLTYLLDGNWTASSEL